LPAAFVDIDLFDDIAGNINGSISLIGEVRKGRFGPVYLDLGRSDAGQPPEGAHGVRSA
jgi:hypothetical protein